METQSSTLLRILDYVEIGNNKIKEEIAEAAKIVEELKQFDAVDAILCESAIAIEDHFDMPCAIIPGEVAGLKYILPEVYQKDLVRV